MTTALLAGALAMVVAAVGRRRLRYAPRPMRPHVGRAHRRPPSALDYASLLDAIARQVRSGSSVTSAACDEIERFSPLGQVADRLACGDSLADALTAVTPGDADLALTMQALLATAHLGGPIAATLDEAAAVLRERAAARAERRAQGSQARLSGRVLTIVPLGYAAWSLGASERTRDVYITAAGAVCVLCGLALNLVGWRWMKRIVGPA